MGTESEVAEGKERECCWLVRSGGVVLVRSQTQLLWPIYPCHSSSSRGCGGGLDELARQSMKHTEREREREKESV